MQTQEAQAHLPRSWQLVSICWLELKAALRHPVQSCEDKMALSLDSNPTVTLREKRNWGRGGIPGAHFPAHRLGFLFFSTSSLHISSSLKLHGLQLTESSNSLMTNPSWHTATLELKLMDIQNWLSAWGTFLSCFWSFCCCYPEMSSSKKMIGRDSKRVIGKILQSWWVAVVSTSDPDHPFTVAVAHTQPCSLMRTPPPASLAGFRRGFSVLGWWDWRCTWCWDTGLGMWNLIQPREPVCWPGLWMQGQLSVNMVWEPP